MGLFLLSSINMKTKNEILTTKIVSNKQVSKHNAFQQTEMRTKVNGMHMNHTSLSNV